MSDPIQSHFDEALQRASTQSHDSTLITSAQQFMTRSHKLQYHIIFLGCHVP